VAPSVYSGLLPAEEAHAQGWTSRYLGATPIGEVTAGAAAQAAGTYVVCNLGGYVQGWLASIFPWLFTPVTAGETAVLLGVTGVAVTAGAQVIRTTPAMYAGVSGAYAAERLTSVPTNSTHSMLAELALITHLGAANAQLGAIAGSNQAGAQSESTTAINQGSVTFRDCVLNPLMWAAKDAFIQIITNDIIDWIEGGFEGTPAFLSDPEDFFIGVADTVLQDFLYNSGLDEFLCDPFALDVIFGISMDYSRPAYGRYGKLSCSLDEIFPGIDINIDTDGDGVPDATVSTPNGNQAFDMMANDGEVWDYSVGLVGAAMIADHGNNAMGTQLQLREQVSQRISAQQSEEGMKLDAGKGWFSLKCDVDDDFVEDGVCTPGEFVAGHINNYTNSALEQLTIADEFSEILNALFSALVQQLLEEATDGGGLGLRR
jgi:hypothetical protein